MTGMKLAALAAVSALSLGAVGAAHAATLNFSYAGLDVYGDEGVFSFAMDSMPTPLLNDGDYSATFNVTGDFDHQTQAFYITFNSNLFNGGFDAFTLTSTGDIDEEFTGEGLYRPDGTFQTDFTGSTTAPMFSPGVFNTYYTAPLANSDTFNQVQVGALTISGDATPGVPEPGEWALMLVGLGLAGGLLRSRKRGAVAGRVSI